MIFVVEPVQNRRRELSFANTRCRFWEIFLPEEASFPDHFLAPQRFTSSFVGT
jgi:hypothetical protein